MDYVGDLNPDRRHYVLGHAGKKKSEGAPTGSEGLGIKPSKGESSTHGVRKAVISPATLNEVATLA